MVTTCLIADGKGLAFNEKTETASRQRGTLKIASLDEVPGVRGTRPKGARTMPAKKILLVDDSETILQMEQMLLQNEPYELVVAKDGVEGVAKALEFHPDLILMDVVMPRMDGFEAVRQLRDNRKTCAVPIVMVTTQSEADSMEVGYVNGCSDYIVKPIDGLELITKVKNLLGD